MKYKNALSHLATVLAAAMLTVCPPAASPAADDASDARRAPAARSGSPPQCPLPPRAPDGRAGDGIRDAGGSDPSPVEPDDPAGALLEDLVHADRRPGTDTLLPTHRPPRTEVRRLPVTR